MVIKRGDFERAVILSMWMKFQFAIKATSIKYKGSLTLYLSSISATEGHRKFYHD